MSKCFIAGCVHVGRFRPVIMVPQRIKPNALRPAHKPLFDPAATDEDRKRVERMLRVASLSFVGHDVVCEGHKLTMTIIEYINCGALNMEAVIDHANKKGFQVNFSEATLLYHDLDFEIRAKLTVKEIKSGRNKEG
jgi:hypothetical protein